MKDTKSIHKGLLHFYALTMNYQKREIKKTIPFTISSKRIKYLEINLAKKVKNLYTKNYKTLIKEVEEDQVRGKLFQAHSFDELILLKCLYYPKRSVDSMQSISKFQEHFHWKIFKNPKMFMEPQNTPNRQSNLEKEEQS